MSQVITLTFGDGAENSAGMQVIGARVPPGQGFNYTDLVAAKNALEAQGVECDLVHLGAAIPTCPEAHVLVIRAGVDHFLAQNQTSPPKDHTDLFAEQVALDFDTQTYLPYGGGRVVEKKARYNLCYDYAPQEPDYTNKKGRIIAFDSVPLTNHLRTALPQFLGQKAADLKIESNYYYDTSKCGIKFHGDSERRKVVGARLGNGPDSMPMYWQWYQKHGTYTEEAVGEKICVPLHTGDMYVMSEKAVGTDCWNKFGATPRYVVRHATGSSQYTGVPKPTPVSVDNQTTLLRFYPVK